jgi:hypothetical protein
MIDSTKPPPPDLSPAGTTPAARLAGLRRLSHFTRTARRRNS